MVYRSPRLAVLACLSLAALVAPAPAARAQTFAELAAGAREPGRDLATLAAHFFASCDALVGRSRELCDANLGRAAAEVTGATLLLSMPAEGRVLVGPYEPRGGGFRVTVPGFEVVRPTGGVVGTRARRNGVMPRHVVAETFLRVPAHDAGDFLARNGAARLRLRLLVRFGEPYEDPRPRRPEERRGVVVEVLAAQVYNASAGDVLHDSTAPAATLPEAPALLESRTALWTARRQRDVLFRTPDGDGVLFHARTERVDPPGRGVVAVVLATRGADLEELTRFTASAPEASVDLVPHGADGVLVVVTEQRSRRRVPGRGQVVFLRWDAERARAVVVARWRGSNDETPPAWVLDPAAPLPDDPTAPLPDEPAAPPAPDPAPT